MPTNHAYGTCYAMHTDEQNPKKLGSLIVIAYYSRSLRGPELDYPIQHQEMLAIVACCAAFEHFLLCSFFEVRVGGLHGLHAVIIMDLDVHGHALYKHRHACPTTTNGCTG